MEIKNSVEENKSERNIKNYGRSESAQSISLPEKTELLQCSSESLTHSKKKNTFELTKHSEEVKPVPESTTVPPFESSKAKVTVFPHTFKVVFVGDNAVGKSSILQRILKNNYTEVYRPTTVQSYEKEIDVEDRKIKLKLWDTAGNVKLQRAILPYLCNTDAVLIVYSVIEEDSIQNVKTWIENVKERNPDDTIILIIGTKVDLRKSEEAFETAGKQFTTENKAFFFETSAKTGEGIEEIMNTLLRLLLCKFNKSEELS
ncbi:GTP-binding protein ryh1-like [Stegodyphus dumicola]|uniref:GTP-binding protein ryh1-like n=1 Tax=Stegodyphus dumicola TaxID=202533 RepID=UPI0015A76582|nr:GTP-binding protein ryh1-like [Stegodyphus dumicola]